MFVGALKEVVTERVLNHLFLLPHGSLSHAKLTCAKAPHVIGFTFAQRIESLLRTLPLLVNTSSRILHYPRPKRIAIDMTY